MELTSCPECGAPAQVEQRHVLESTDGPVEHVKIRCVGGHWFFLPSAALEHAVRARPGAPRAAEPEAPCRRARSRR
jgi:hypothetical protein